MTRRRDIIKEKLLEEGMVASFRGELLKIQDEAQLRSFFGKKATKVFDNIFYCAGIYGDSYKELYNNLKETWQKLYKKQLKHYNLRKS